MLFAFSRDGAVPGSRTGASSTPTGSRPTRVMLVGRRSRVILTLPALVKVDINGAPVPVAFFAVVSIGVIGLYLAFAIPICLRWRLGDASSPASWTLGSKYKWMNLIAVAEIVDHLDLLHAAVHPGRRARATTASPGSS